MRLSFEQLAESIAHPSFSLRPKARLRRPEAPAPFVPPDLRVHDNLPNPLHAEVIFVEASAAVGKSTMAKALAARTGAPFLDLAEIPVSTQSLVGILQTDFLNVANPIAAFHKGELPLVIDALDEGRLLSGEQSFERFLETTGELLQQSRGHTTKPKLVFFGRPDSIGLTKTGLELGGSDFSGVSIEVDFFEEAAARRLIDAYALAVAAPTAPYRRHPEPVRHLIDAYFAAIEAALGLDEGTLWSSQRGRAFAGYAPVLAAVGSLLAEFDNFQDLRNKLRSQGVHEAWSVIESVLETILDREQRKLTEKLQRNISTPVPNEAYDRVEQLTLLTRWVHGQAPEGTRRVKLGGADLSAYHTMVNQYIGEHPFVRQRDPANSVLGSLILAHAIHSDLLRGTDRTLLAKLSRQPFLWRSLSRLLQTDNTPLDGRYVGFALNSLWNDPIREDSEVAIRSTSEDGAMRVAIRNASGKKQHFDAISPLSLYGRAQRCTIDVDCDIELHGQAAPGTNAAFVVRGPVELSCVNLTVETDVLTFEGRSWLEAQSVMARPRLELRLKDGAEVGWSGQFAETYPWNRFPSTVPAPHSAPPGSTLEALLDECCMRLPPGSALTLRPDFTNPDDVRLRWVDRQFATAFASLIRIMVAHGVASTEALAAQGEAKVRVRLSGTWEDIRNAYHGAQVSTVYAALIRDARNTIG